MKLKDCPNCGGPAAIRDLGITEEGQYVAQIICYSQPHLHFDMSGIGSTRAAAEQDAAKKWNTRKKTPEGATSHFNSITDLDIPQWMFHIKHSDCLYSVGQHLVAFNVLKDYIKVFRLYDAENMDFSVNRIGINSKLFVEFTEHDDRIDQGEWLDNLLNGASNE